MRQYPRGSEWRKWDLHVHTPKSIIQFYGGDNDEVWENFICELEKLPKEIEVLGINDYLFIDGYKKVLEYKNNGRLSNIKLLLPVIEFRLKEFVGSDKKINQHIIFADSSILNTNVIQEQFLSKLHSSCHLDSEYVSSPTWGGSITRESLEDLGTQIYNNTPEDKRGSLCNESYLKIGFNNLSFPNDKILEALGEQTESNTYLQDKYLKAIGLSEWEQMKWERSPKDKKDLINNNHFIFTASPTCEKVQEKKNTLKENGVHTRVLHASDAHQIPENPQKCEPRYLGHCFTWIKADPTFEGLKQVVYEPEERVRIQETSPEYEHHKSYFDKINILDDIKKVYDKDENLTLKQSDIPLNKNLITVIGGRGEGKSTLINYLGNIFGKLSDTYANYLTHNENFQVHYHKINDKEIPEEDQEVYNGTKKELDFVFIEQGYLKNNSNDLSHTLKNILNVENTDFPEELTIKIKDINSDINDCESWLKYTDDHGDKVHTTEYNKQKEQKYTELLNTITNSKNRNHIQKYNQNLGSVLTYENEKHKLRSILEKTDKFIKDIQSIHSTLDSNFVNVDSVKIDNGEKNLFSEIQQYKSNINNQIETIDNKVGELNNTNEDIKNKLKQQGVEGDLTRLLENTKFYRQKIYEAQNTLKEIEFQQNYLKEKKEKRSQIAEEIKEVYCDQENDIDEKWESFLSVYSEKEKERIQQHILGDKLHVSGKIRFDKEIFYDVLWDALHQGKHKRDNLEQEFNIHNFESWIDYIGNSFNQKYDEITHKKEDFKNVFFDNTIRNQYVRVEAQMTYDGKDLSRLSAGQKGTAFLRIQLANRSFHTPLVFDQPEDDLDNKFIVDELVNMFKNLKHYRQIIIVTHNANLVVNSDAEQVIVANNEDEHISYSYGSLENESIKNQVCHILEGGETAFKNREKIYNIS